MTPFSIQFSLVKRERIGTKEFYLLIKVTKKPTLVDGDSDFINSPNQSMSSISNKKISPILLLFTIFMWEQLVRKPRRQTDHLISPAEPSDNDKWLRVRIIKISKRHFNRR